MDYQKIGRYIQSLVENEEISGGSLLIRQGEQIAYQNLWGWADVSKTQRMEEYHIFRMMSMTKPVTAVGILKLYEQGKLSIDDPLCKFIPEFRNMRVVKAKGIGALSLLPQLVSYRPEKVKTVPAVRDITIRDLLSHSSGLSQGLLGLIGMVKDKRIRESLQQQAKIYASRPLDFQPGTGTGYSPIAGFDMLGLVIERASGMDASTFFRKEIFEPLDMPDSTFWLTKEQAPRLVDACKRKSRKLFNVTGTGDDMDGMLHRGEGYIAGCGGLYSTLHDYDHFAQMLLQKGSFRGVQFLCPETVELMQTEAPAKHMEPEKGQVWGLGVRIRQNDGICTPGTYGWSGAFGTHFFISPKDNLSVLWMTSRTDIGGSGSYVSKRLEELVFEEMHHA